MITKDLPIQNFQKLTPLQKKALAKLGLRTVTDLLRHFPSRYGETGQIKPIGSLLAHENTIVYGRISKLKLGKTFRSKKTIATAEIEDTTAKIKIAWFNQPYIAKMFAEQDLVRIEGIVSQKRKKGEASKDELYFSNPKIEKVDYLPEGGTGPLFQNNENQNLNPIYPESRGISSNWLYYTLKKLIQNKILDTLEDPIPPNILKKYNLPSIKTAFIWIHFPQKKEDAEIARKRFAFEEMFLIQIDRQKEKFIAKKEKTFIIKKDKKEIGTFIKTFPFPLTGAQQRGIETILSDFQLGFPMSRLLEGDVGSGKTAVAATASFATVTTTPPDRQYGNLQVVYMAPTEILAEQHFESFIQYFKNYKIPIGLLTGGGAKKFPSKTTKDQPTKISKTQLLKWVENGEIPILIGTHALIQKTVAFKNLALIIIDEQHKFGVKQRKALRQKSKNEKLPDIAPHLLSMTATPIPRTLALTIFGDLDLSLLDELPAGRKLPNTQIVLPHQREETYEKIREELKSGRQVYVICPRINDPDPDKENAINAKSVKSEAERLSKNIFPEYKIGQLTGDMKAADKEKTMRDFKEKKYQILVATSVIEVGVNVPNATVILIENAERFGLAQLHQLRGRVLRSSHQPHCFVFAESQSQKTIDRLKSFVTAKNGFELAEADLKQRGSGDLSGTKQWGVSDLAMEALKNIKMVEAARLEAQNIIEKDFDLKNYPILKKHLESKSSVHME